MPDKRKQNFLFNPVFLSVVILTLVAVLIWSYAFNVELYQDESGVFHGTGKALYKYENQDSLAQEDAYVWGYLTRSKWFHPDGRILYETYWGIQGNGTGYYLYDDGSLKSEVEFQSGVAEGIGKVYDRAGNLIKIQTYKDGSVVSEKIVSSNSE